MRDEGQKFHDSRTPEETYETSLSREESVEYAPSRSSTSSKFIFFGKRRRGKTSCRKAGCRCRGHVVTDGPAKDKRRQIIPTRPMCIYRTAMEGTTTRHRDHPLLPNLTMLFSA